MLYKLTRASLIEFTDGLMRPEDQAHLIAGLEAAGVYSSDDPDAVAAVDFRATPFSGNLDVDAGKVDILLYLSNDGQAVNLTSENITVHDKEIFVSGAGADVLVNYCAGQTIISGDGDDHISLNLGFCTVYGGVGDDRVDSVSGGNLVYGGAGDDTLQGPESGTPDTLYGGEGNDYIKSLAPPWTQH